MVANRRHLVHRLQAEDPLNLSTLETSITWSTSAEMALKRLKACKVITSKVPVVPDFYDEDPKVLDVACKEWFLGTLEDDEVTTHNIITNRKKFKKQLAGE